MSQNNGARRSAYINAKGEREPGIYTSTSASGEIVFEIGFRDAQGIQRWRTVRNGGIRAARVKLAQAHAQRSRGERVAADPRLRFDAAADQWWTTRVTKLRPTTQSAYGAGLKHLRAQFGRQRMADITPADVARFVALQQSRGQKGWTIKGQLTVLNSIWTYSARHLGLPGTNPVALLDRVERPNSDDERPKRILSSDELERLLRAIPERHRLVFEVAAETGGRLSEVLGLAWKDIDTDAQTLTFTHQLDRARKRVPLKTKRSRRCIEISASLVSRLRAHRMASSGSGDHDLVFTTRTGAGHDHRNIGGRVLARAVKAAGLEAVTQDGTIVLHAPTFHSLRHSHASALIGGGWDIEEVSNRLGHSNVATTQRIYIHQYDAARRSESRRSRLPALYAPAVEARVEALEGTSPHQNGAEIVRLPAVQER